MFVHTVRPQSEETKVPCGMNFFLQLGSIDNKQPRSPHSLRSVNILGKTSGLRINVNRDGTPTSSRSHTHPSHSQTSLLLSSSLSLLLFRSSGPPLNPVYPSLIVSWRTTLLQTMVFVLLVSSFVRTERVTIGSHPHSSWWSYGPWTVDLVNSTLDRVRTESGDCRCEYSDIDCGTRHVRVRWRNFCVYEQVTSLEWLRRSTRMIETFATTSTVSPMTLFRVLWRTHLTKIVEYLHTVLHHIIYDVFTNDSSVCLHLHGSSWRHLCCFFRLDICVWVCIILVYVCMYVYTWRSVIFFLFRMKTFHYVVILEDRENMDPSSEK